jgi:hypothetical protein
LLGFHLFCATEAIEEHNNKSQNDLNDQHYTEEQIKNEENNGRKAAIETLANENSRSQRSRENEYREVSVTESSSPILPKDSLSSPTIQLHV